MAKFDLKFLDAVEDGAFIKTTNTEDAQGNFIVIHGKNTLGYFEIWLDKSTAIKFAKTLRTEINKITAREEGKDGRG